MQHEKLPSNLQALTLIKFVCRVSSRKGRCEQDLIESRFVSALFVPFSAARSSTLLRSPNTSTFLAADSGREAFQKWHGLSHKAHGGTPGIPELASLFPSISGSADWPYHIQSRMSTYFEGIRISPCDCHLRSFPPEEDGRGSTDAIGGA